MKINFSVIAAPLSNSLIIKEFEGAGFPAPFNISLINPEENNGYKKK